MSASHARASAHAASLALVWCCVQIAYGQVPLDKLTDCDGLAMTREAVLAWVDRAPNECQSPNNAIGRATLERSQMSPSAVCFLRKAPSAELSGFSCFVIRSAPSAQLICYRPVLLSDVRNYKARFSDKFDSASVEYMRKAATCAASGGDTGALSALIYPYPLLFVSRLEFGFIGNLNIEPRNSGKIIHAFARVDPSLRGAPDAIEVFSLSVGGTIKRQDSTKVHRANGWKAFIEEGDDLDQQFNEHYKKMGVPVRVHSINIELSRPTDFSGTNKSRIGQLHADLVRGLEAEGFEEQDLDELRLSDGRSFIDAFAEMKEAGTPFGMRREYSVAEQVGPVAFLINQRRPPCVRTDKGWVMALVGANKPDPNEASDYGTISVTIMGAGACAYFAGPTGRYVNGLLTDAKQHVLETLERRR